jgi:hypothetical protein
MDMDKGEVVWKQRIGWTGGSCLHPKVVTAGQMRHKQDQQVQLCRNTLSVQDVLFNIKEKSKFGKGVAFWKRQLSKTNPIGLDEYVFLV